VQFIKLSNMDSAITRMEEQKGKDFGNIEDFIKAEIVNRGRPGRG